MALTEVYGSGTSSLTLDDLTTADLAVVVGANPASNHPRLITELVNLRRRGGRVIVINPLRELGLVRFRVPSDWRSLLFGSDVSDLYLQPHIGSDVALLKALLKGVIEAGGVDDEFVATHTNGWEQVRADMEAADWEQLVDTSGVPRGQIDEAVRLLLAARGGVFLWAMGLTHHAHGVDNILALSNLALALGWLGRPGCGLLPIRGHSNVQGVGSVGMAPALKEAFARAMEEAYAITVPREPGQDTYASMLAAERSENPRGRAAGREPLRQQPGPPLGRGGAALDPALGLADHEAQRRPHPRPGAHIAAAPGAGARRGVAAHDAGVDVQLRATLRRRSPGR